MSKMKYALVFVVFVCILSFFAVNGKVFAVEGAHAADDQPLLALDSGRFNKYANYQIYFYDQDASNCIKRKKKGGGSEEPFVGDEEWDGSCTAMTATRIAWLEKYLSAIQSVASEKGLPWELIPAQVFKESGGGKSEACDKNPLGLKAKNGHASCSNGFARFNSYEEAFAYYADSIIPIREVQGMYPDDPYSAIAYIQYGGSHPYAVCDSESYEYCKGHMGEPTPGYVQDVSSIICGIQKWAQSEGISISAVTWENYSGGGDSNEENEEEKQEEEQEKNEENEEENEEDDGENYCDDDESEDDDPEDPQAGDLVSYVKAWAWPNYEAGKTERKQAYADYIDNESPYPGDCDGVDCGAFVSNIIVASGWDTSYQRCSSYCQKQWLDANWNMLENADSLKLGDVGYKPGHIILYVGNIPGFNSNTASASRCDRAPMAGADKNLNKYTWYRKK